MSHQPAGDIDRHASLFKISAVCMSQIIHYEVIGERKGWYKFVSVYSAPHTYIHKAADIIPHGSPPCKGRGLTSYSCSGFKRIPAIKSELRKKYVRDRYLPVTCVRFWILYVSLFIPCFRYGENAS